MNRQFCQAVDEDGKFTGNLEVFRLRHQHLSHIVEEADLFMSIGNVGEFVCQFLNSVIVLYSIIFFPSEIVTAKVSLILYFAMNLCGVFSAVLNGVMVNYEVRLVRKYDIFSI